jgi:hypothetical protein
MILLRMASFILLAEVSCFPTINYVRKQKIPPIDCPVLLFPTLN